MTPNDLRSAGKDLVGLAKWLITHRRSCRKFNGEPVSMSVLEDLVEAGTWGPTGANQQNVRFMILPTHARMQELGKLKTQYKLVGSASAGILVVTDTSLKLPKGEEHIWQRLWPSNAAAAIQNILLLATAYGLGSCWLSFYKEMGLTRLTTGKRWRELFPEFDIPMHWDVQGLVLLGPTDEKDTFGFPLGDLRHCGNEVPRPGIHRFLAQPEGKRLRACLTGSFGGGDIGDDAMVFPHLQSLDMLGLMKEDIWLIGHDPDYMAKHFHHPRANCLKSDPFRPPGGLLRNIDMLIVTGGGTINTRDEHGYSIKRAHSLIMPFVKRAIPVFMSGQTIGPLGTNKLHDTIAKEIIQGVDVLTVRDKGYSREYIDKIGAKPKVFVETCDDAAAIEYEHEYPPIKLPPGKKAVVNITVYTYDTPEKRKAVKELCERLMEKKYHVVLLPHHQWDYEQLKGLHAQLPATTLVNTTGWRGSVSKKLMSQCDLVIGGRYHVVVFAMTALVPCVGMAGNHYSWIKQRGFAEQLGLEDVIVPQDHVTNVNTIMRMVELARKLGPSGKAADLVPGVPEYETWLKERVLK